MDIRIPIFIGAAGLLAFFTRRGGKSGELMNRFSTLRRAEYPRMFAVMLAMRWGFVLVLCFGALAMAVGWIR